MLDQAALCFQDVGGVFVSGRQAVRRLPDLGIDEPKNTLSATVQEQERGANTKEQKETEGEGAREGVGGAGKGAQ